MQALMLDPELQERKDSLERAATNASRELLQIYEQLRTLFQGRKLDLFALLSPSTQRWIGLSYATFGRVAPLLHDIAQSEWRLESNDLLAEFGAAVFTSVNFLSKFRDFARSGVPWERARAALQQAKRQRQEPGAKLPRVAKDRDWAPADVATAMNSINVTQRRPRKRKRVVSDEEDQAELISDEVHVASAASPIRSRRLAHISIAPVSVSKPNGRSRSTSQRRNGRYQFVPNLPTFEEEDSGVNEEDKEQELEQAGDIEPSVPEIEVGRGVSIYTPPESISSPPALATPNDADDFMSESSVEFIMDETGHSPAPADVDFQGDMLETYSAQTTHLDTGQKPRAGTRSLHESIAGDGGSMRRVVHLHSDGEETPERHTSFVTNKPSLTAIPENLQATLEGALKQLEPESWLGQEAIERVLNMCTIYPFFSVAPLPAEPDRDWDVWSRSHKLRRKTWQCKVLVPILQSAHWVLAYVNMRAYKITFYDSMASRKSWQSVAQALVAALGEQWDPQVWSQSLASDMPQQPNAYDCGMHVLLTSIFLMAELSLPTTYDCRLWRTLFRNLLRKAEISQPEIDAFFRQRLYADPADEHPRTAEGLMRVIEASDKHLDDLHQRRRTIEDASTLVSSLHTRACSATYLLQHERTSFETEIDCRQRHLADLQANGSLRPNDHQTLDAARASLSMSQEQIQANEQRQKDIFSLWQMVQSVRGAVGESDSGEVVKKRNEWLAELDKLRERIADFMEQRRKV
ncbi:hypothetical protein LTR50_007347 [Elasticomyces elasticus]|nr:hypothetical protein LTR50_007347 [Elasticomyces elasticus]